MVPRFRESEREEAVGRTRRLLLEAAAEEFARHGYVGANINRISQAAGFAKGTIYNYFPSKRALIYSLIDVIAEAHLSYIVEEVEQEEHPVRRLERFFEAGFAFIPQNLAQARAMVNIVYGPDIDLRMRCYEAYRPLFEFVGRAILAAGMTEGVFRQMDAEAMSRLLMTLYLGTASQTNEEGYPWLQPSLVAEFASHGLLAQSPMSM
jgi:AcrR family transcriptional regulator